MLIEVNSAYAPSGRMPLTTSPERADQKLTGQALRAIREERGMVQGQIAEHLGVTTQAWQKYEAGERKFTEDRLHRVLAILNATLEQLEFEKARLLGAPTAKSYAPTHPFPINVFGRSRLGQHGPGVYEAAEPFRTIDLRQIIGPNSGAIELADDRMAPWGSSGEVVIFDRDRAPRRGFGCVVEMNDGTAIARLFERSDGSTLFVSELQPEPRTITIALAEVRGVYAVRFRGD